MGFVPYPYLCDLLIADWRPDPFDRQYSAISGNLFERVHLEVSTPDENCTYASGAQSDRNGFWYQWSETFSRPLLPDIPNNRNRRAFPSRRGPGSRALQRHP